MNTLGISCHYHDSAACLIQDGTITAAAEEARFSRVHHDTRFPAAAIDYCLYEGGVHLPSDIDHVVFYEKPMTKLRRIVDSHLEHYPRSFHTFRQGLSSTVGKALTLTSAIQDHVGFEEPPSFVEHHLSHAASAFYPSPFERAAVLTVDGTGEWATTTLGLGEGNRLRLLKEIRFPHSLGLLYSAITAHLGFSVNSGEGKVMGLASYGEPEFAERLREILNLRPDGSFALDMRYFDFSRAFRMCSARFAREFGAPRRADDELTDRHRNLAASLQAVLEEAMVRMAAHLHELTGSRDLCLAGGVALNGPSNVAILEQTPFERIFVQPAPGDSGGAVGAAAWVQHGLLDIPRREPLRHAFLGPAYDDSDVRGTLDAHGRGYRQLDDDALCATVAERLAAGDVVCWYQGRMEFGPRALGNRSILADPRRAEMKDVINARIKHREPFRPFAPAVPTEHADTYFELPAPSPFMSLVGRVHADRRAELPAVTHVDGTARAQTVDRDSNPRFHRLLETFGERTGTPVLLNTSFNVRGQPIVCTPEEAVRTFEQGEADLLVMNGYLIHREGGSDRETLVSELSVPA